MEGFGGRGAAVEEAEGDSWSWGSWERKGKVEMAARSEVVGFRVLWRRAWARPRIAALEAMHEVGGPVSVGSG